LERLNLHAIDHYGHTCGAYRLLLRRFLNRNTYGTGELFRAAIGRPHFWFVVRNDNNCVLCFLVAGWWSTIAVAALAFGGMTAVFTIGAIAILPVAAMSVRWRSLCKGLYSVATWNVFALSFMPGLLRQRVPPIRWIDSLVVHNGLVPIEASEFKSRDGRQPTEIA
jgi:uncharacterized membrane protein YphA (DoxX/SURF4 family)